MAAPRTIAVTGASRGIGAAIALELARRGFTVACLTRSGESPSRPHDAAGRFIDVRCDVTDEASVARALAEAADEGEGLVGLVNNAGIHLDGKSHEFPTIDWQRMMATNATSVFVACREAYPHLVACGGGLIVNIGSFYDRIGVKRNLAYCASKAAVGAITRCLAVEWAAKNIRVVDVAPGYIVTDLNREAMADGPLHDYLAKRIPAGRAGGVTDVARLVGALYSEDIPFLTGETIYLDGAQGIAH
ncbi:MAG: SDR family oxidoreductase [Proteobacteria bacterium]|nr:SDR family oxidoreductase [Burkholderiales bacterium]